MAKDPDIINILGAIVLSYCQRGEAINCLFFPLKLHTGLILLFLRWFLCKYTDPLKPKKL